MTPMNRKYIDEIHYSVLNIRVNKNKMICLLSKNMTNKHLVLC